MRADDGTIPGLSFTDSMILAFLRDGTLDAETAVRLGLTVGDVRARVAALMVRLQFTSREQLLTWDAAAAPADVAAGGYSNAAATETRATPADLSRRWKFIGGIAAVLALVCAGVGWAFTAGEPVGPVSRLPGTIATGPASPQFIAGAPVTRLQVEPAQPLPAGLTLSMLANCECGVPPTQVTRLSRDAAGRMTSDVLFNAAERGGAFPYITSAWAEGDGARMAAAVCIVAGCGGSGDPLSAGARTTIWESFDYGSTWQTRGVVIEGSISILGPRGAELYIRIGRSGPSGQTDSVAAYPPGTELNLPVNPGTTVTLGRGNTGWLDRERPLILSVFDRELLTLREPGARPLAGVSAHLEPGRALALSWYPAAPTPDTDDYRTLVAEADAAGVAARVVEHTGAGLVLGPWLSDHALLVTMNLFLPQDTAVPPGEGSWRRVPAVLDFETSTLLPLILDEAGRGTGGRVLAATWTRP